LQVLTLLLPAAVAIPMTLPRPLLPFVAFATLLRANGFAVAPEQTQTFIAATGLLGPRSIEDIHRAARATLAPPPERFDDFDALFRLAFLGQTLAAPTTGETDDEVEAFDDRDGGDAPPETEEAAESGGEPSGAERLFARAFAGISEVEALRRFRRAAPGALPRRRSRRLMSTKGRGQPDLRRALRDAVKRDGEILRLPVRARRERRRRVLLLIDVSGSMKERTDGHLRFAHALTRAADRVEIFTLGTRLTRVTRALRRRDPAQALDLAATLVADWDGGTRLGDALQAFLAVPRFSGFARGALVVVLSDGLERGDPAAMIDAVERLSRLAWGLLWLSPLAGAAGFAVETAALKAALPHLDRLGDGSTADRLCAEVLGFQRRAA
jgi:uncharacterized protein with von Willebrand factor type A (vWA) domain